MEPRRTARGHVRSIPSRGRTSYRGLLAVVTPILAAAVVAIWMVLRAELGAGPADTLTYLAAGERLNAGHLLYALSPGDRPVPLNPPQWTTPLVSPPLIAVIWRPLAALPGELGVPIWIAAVDICVIGLLVAMALRQPYVAAIVVLLFSLPLAFELGVANLDGLLLVGLVSVWTLSVHHRWGLVGFLVGAMTVLKVSPAVIAVWALSLGGAPVLWGIGTGAGLALALALLGAGIGANVEYVHIALSTAASGSSWLSLAGMARTIGVPPPVAAVLPTALIVLSLALIILLRHRPGLTFAVAVFCMVYGIPSVNPNTLCLLIAASAPLVLRRPSEVVSRLYTPAPIT